jgi:replicative DNA helicase
MPRQLVLPTGLHFPQSVGEISREFDARIREGRLEGYLPIPTGFAELDEVLGGGFLSGCLLLLGGRQNVGKTIWTLQAARNVALAGYTGCLVCYEHDEVHLFHRLLCLESYLAAGEDRGGVTLMDIREAVLRAVPGATGGPGYGESAPFAQGLQTVLQAHPGARRAWDGAVAGYLDRLLITRGHPVKTTLNVLRTYATWLSREQPGRAVLFVDYLQKVPYSLDSHDLPERGRFGESQTDVILVTQGLKDLALEFGVPVVAVAAVDPEGLKRDEPRVEDLLGGSAVKYEPDAVIMMLPRWHEGKRDVGFVVAKNRAGPTDVEVIHPLVGRHFCFAPDATAVQPYSRGGEQ